MKVSELIEMLKELKQEKKIQYSDVEYGNQDIDSIAEYDNHYKIQ